MLDLLPVIPYYTGHLCAAFKSSTDLLVTLASTTYTHDPSFFRRIGVHTDAVLIDVASRFANAIVRRPLKLLEYLCNLAAFMLRIWVSRPDIVHVQFVPLLEHHLPFEVWFLALTSRRGTKLVYTVHNVLPHDTAGRCRAAYARIYKLVDGFICHDDGAKARLMAEFGVDPERVIVIPHGPLFDAEHAPTSQQARARLALPTDKLIVLWQGIIRPYKGISFLLNAWKRVQERGFRGILVIVGTGEPDLLRSIREEVRALGLESTVRLEFRFVSVDELTAFYSAADILVYPYAAVTTSGALMTGIGHGKAIVASALPGFERILHDEHNALLAPFGSVEPWADALTRLGGDVELRLRLGRAMQATHATGSNWKDIARQTVNFYQKVLDFAPAAGRSRGQWFI